MSQAVAILPHVNAALNTLATILLVIGFVLIKRKHVRGHKWAMLSCFAVSVVFLVCYLSYHQLLYAVTGQRGHPFEYPGIVVRYVYFTILISHVVLAAAVPFLAVTTIYFALRAQFGRHRRLARWTYPIWLYVSVTGVVVYVMLYHLYRVPEVGVILVESRTPCLI